MNWLVTMRTAALWRHKILVEFWYPEGPERSKAMVEHYRIVQMVYGW
jgi:hypothetical protein